METIVLGSDEAGLSVDAFIRQMGPAGAEIRDAQGRVIAYVIPSDRLQAMEAAAMQDIDAHKDEIRAALARRGGKSTAQLLDTLNAIPLPQRDASHP